MKTLRWFKITSLSLLFLGASVVFSGAQTVDDYSSLPPFLAGSVPPNILLLMDNSGSMNDSAYYPPGASSTTYNAATAYGGYFDNTKCYTYASSRFTVAGSRAGSSPYCSNAWDGNFLNWLTMRKIEITKWVMMGGKCAPRVTGNCYPGGKLTADNPSVSFTKTMDATGMVPTTYNGNRAYCRNSSTLYVKTSVSLTSASCSTSGTASFSLTIDISSEPTGVIQQVGATKARFGLMEFNTTGDGGIVKAGVGDPLTSMVNAIENTSANTWTPLSEALYEAGRYFAQITPAYGNSDFSSNVQNKDPYYFTSTWANPARYVQCCKSFIIVFTDGQPTQDLNIPTSLQGYASSFYSAQSNCALPGGCTTTHTTSSHKHTTFSNHFDNCSIYYGGESGDACQYSGSHYLDDVAYWLHETDLRPPVGTNIAGINVPGSANTLTGTQNITVYTFFAFGTGANILKDSAKMGGFIDKNGDGKPGPDSTEWDAVNNMTGAKVPDGVPDTYFDSVDAFAMKDSLVAAINSILQRSASGTSVSVLATSSGGEGAIYQAYFYPSLVDGTREISWLGYLQGLFFDAAGQLREDTNQDGRLVLTDDKIIETFFDTSTNETKVRRYDVDSNGNKTGSGTIIALTELKPFWEAGKVLAQRDFSANPRKIFTWVDKNGDGVVNSGEYIDFSTANEATLRPYLRAASSTEGTDIINFIRGNVVTGYRDRQVTVDGVLQTWRLGDIIYSSPVSVGAPAERFDQKYQDSTYTPFYTKYSNRRHVVYVGANDGMLHAVNSGFFHPGDDLSTSAVEHGWFSKNADGTDTGGKLYGEELWAFVPQELLTHLKWLTQTTYDKTKHVYYVDGSPRITDAKIFTEEAACATSLSSASCVHPGGWGTVLIGSMRLGGGLLKTDLNGNSSTNDTGEDRFRSAYFALDITNPEADPTLLWVYKDSDLGFTTSWPAIMRFDASTWYTVFGSGPLTYKGERNASQASTSGSSDGNKFGSTVTEYGQVYVVNLKDGTLVRKIQIDSTDRYAFMGDPVVYDLPRDYVTDVLYIGKTFGSYAGGWNGKVHRILTYKSKDPATWVKSVLYDPGRPVLVKSTASMDDANRLWIYFGTGRFFSAGTSSDQADTNTQGLYGIKESGPDGCWAGGWKTGCSSTIPSTKVLDVTTYTVADGGALTCGGCGASTLTQLYTNVINNPTSSLEKEGWKITLSGGERVLQESTILGGIVGATSYIPGSDVCTPQGTNSLWALYYQTGTAYSSSVIGLSGTTVLRSESLGLGVPSKINVVVSDQTITGFVQSSTGAIIQVPGITPATGVRAGSKVWRENTQ